MKKYLVILLAVISLISCNKDESIENNKNIYEGCCSDSPVVFQVGAGKIYVPNMITPNWDGINDVFLPYGNSGISIILNLEIKDRNGSLIFNNDTVIPNNTSFAWLPKLSNGEVYKGLFNYEMEVIDTNGITKIIIGTSCCFACDTNSTVIDDISKCCFPCQTNYNGEFDKSLDNFEYNCFLN